MTGMVETLPGRLEQALSQSLTPGELIRVKLGGAFKEGLVCTDRRVMVLKGGFMTGQFFGTNVFQLPYPSVTSAEVNFHRLTGYFQLSTGGMQNTPKNYWSREPGTDPAKAPNCISISGAAQAQRFREACSFIITKCAEQYDANASSEAIASAMVAALEKLGRPQAPEPVPTPIAPPTLKIPNGRATVLHEAAWRDRIDLAEDALTKFVDVNAPDEEGDTALHIAARNGNRAMVKLLLDHGAHTDLPNANGRRARELL